MAKKQTKKDKEARKLRADQKLKKNLAKAEKKTHKKPNEIEEEEDVDVETLLANFRREQELFSQVAVDSVTKPSARTSCCVIASPQHGKNELLLFGGESMDQETQTVRFFNDLYSFTPDNGQWRRYTSQNSPMPRSSAAMAAHSSGIALINGGEFSTPKQNTFYHYNDTWLLDSSNKEWSKIDVKNGPSARSGHRITTWKNYFILFGGFRDLGTSTTYLNDVWLFDITTYKWKQVEFPTNHSLPDARSGHSWIPTPEGAILWGGYCKVKSNKKGLQRGKILTDCWYLKMHADPSMVRWERRRKQGFQPSPRAGCSMVPHKGRGILFGGVYDYEETEESLESEFYNDLLMYQVETNRWYTQQIRPQKQTSNAKTGKSQRNNTSKSQEKQLQDLLNSILEKNDINVDDDAEQDELEISEKLQDTNICDDSEESGVASIQVMNHLPHARFNAATAVVDDLLFIYGGTWEYADKDFPIDSLYSIDLTKLDCVKVYWEDLADIDRAKEIGDQDSDEDSDEDEEGEDDDDYEEDGENIDNEKLETLEDEELDEPENEEELEIPDPRPWLPHPKPFENLRSFYLREGANFLQWAISNNRDSRGKHLKKISFDLCEDRWWERREQVRFEEEKLEALGVVGSEMIDKDPNAKKTKRR